MLPTIIAYEGHGASSSQLPSLYKRRPLERCQQMGRANGLPKLITYKAYLLARSPCGTVSDDLFTSLLL